MTPKDHEPVVYVFPASVVAEGLHYFFSSTFPRSPSYHLSLDFKPSGKTKVPGVKTVGEYINAAKYIEAWDDCGVEPVKG